MITVQCGSHQLCIEHYRCKYDTKQKLFSLCGINITTGWALHTFVSIRLNLVLNWTTGHTGLGFQILKIAHLEGLSFGQQSARFPLCPYVFPCLFPTILYFSLTLQMVKMPVFPDISLNGKGLPVSPEIPEPVGTCRCQQLLTGTKHEVIRRSMEPRLWMSLRMSMQNQLVRPRRARVICFLRRTTSQYTSPSAQQKQARLVIVKGRASPYRPSRDTVMWQYFVGPGWVSPEGGRGSAGGGGPAKRRCRRDSTRPSAVPTSSRSAWQECESALSNIIGRCHARMSHWWDLNK